jgi:hypothetical protein
MGIKENPYPFELNPFIAPSPFELNPKNPSNGERGREGEREVPHKVKITRNQVVRNSIKSDVLSLLKQTKMTISAHKQAWWSLMQASLLRDL